MNMLGAIIFVLLLSCPLWLVAFDLFRFYTAKSPEQDKSLAGYTVRSMSGNWDYMPRDKEDE